MPANTTDTVKCQCCHECGENAIGTRTWVMRNGLRFKVCTFCVVRHCPPADLMHPRCYYCLCLLPLDDEHAIARGICSYCNGEYELNDPYPDADALRQERAEVMAGRQWDDLHDAGLRP